MRSRFLSQRTTIAVLAMTVSLIAASGADAGSVRTYIHSLETNPGYIVHDSGVLPLGPVSIDAAGHPNGYNGDADPNFTYDDVCVDIDGASFVYQTNVTWGGFTTISASVDATGTELELCEFIRIGAGNTGTVYAGKRVIVETSFDVTFTSEDPVATIPVSLNFMAQGGLSNLGHWPQFGVANWGRIKLWAGPQGTPESTWIAASSTGAPESNSGAFAAESDNKLDDNMGNPGSFTGNEFDAPVGVPVTIILRAELTLHGGYPQGQNVPLPWFWGNLGNNAAGGEGIYLPRDGGPVFNLPDGCTANSVDIDLTNNDFEPEPTNVAVTGSLSSTCGDVLAGVTVSLDHPDAGILTTDTDAGGAFAFTEVPQSPTPGTISVAIPAGYEADDPVGGQAAVGLIADAMVDFSFACGTVTVGGTVSVPCGGAFAGIDVTLDHPALGQIATTTDSLGHYAFADLPYSGVDGSVAVTIPAGFAADSPAGGQAAVSLQGDQVADFELACPPDLSVSGTVSAECDGGLHGVPVMLEHPDGSVLTTVTDENGFYMFDDVPASIYQGLVSLDLPLGYAPVDETGDLDLTALVGDVQLDLSLLCIDAVGQPEDLTYWYMEIRYREGETPPPWWDGPHETDVDMESNFPQLIFDHFVGNPVNPLQIEGVTYHTGAQGPEPLSLAAMYNTMQLTHQHPLLNHSKRWFMALLLNIVSGRIQMSTVVSATGATASQAVQQVAELLATPSNAAYNRARVICFKICRGQSVLSDWIDLSHPQIAYRNNQAPAARALTLAQNYPNPFNPSTTIELAMPRPGPYELTLFDAAGRMVRRYQGSASAGTVSIVWDGRDRAGRPASAGTYFYRATAGGEQQTRKMTLVK